MLKIKVSTAEAVIQETEIITAGRRGLVCEFEFDSAWDGLAKTAVVSGVVKRDIMLTSNSIVVPGECVEKENFPLRIGVYGANGAGDIAIPTVWASFGKILPSAKRSDIPPDELTPDLVSQIEQNSANAIYLAQQVMNMASSGAFNGQEGPQGPTGPQGPEGPEGPEGPTGPGVKTGGSTGQYLRKASGTNYDTEWATLPTEVFWATYGSTTSLAINTAYVAGKVCLCAYGDKIYQLAYSDSSSDHSFVCVVSNTVYYVRCTNSVWSNGSLALGTYSKPGTGIPETDLASAVQASLGLADSALQDPGGGSAGQVYSKTANGYEWTANGGGGGTGAFVVTYTFGNPITCDKTYSEIMTALQAKTPIVVVGVSSGTVGALVCDVFVKLNGDIVFSVTNGPGGQRITHTSADVITTDSWDNSLVNSITSSAGTQPVTEGAIYDALALKANATSVPAASTATPQALGTAAAGSSADFSRADHVHKMPSASDVGAIAAPVSPSSDDVLTYSNGAWAAAAPAHQIPAGGNAGECLAKNSSSDYDLRWRTINDWTPAGLMRTAGGTAAKVAEWSFWSATQYPAWLVVTVGNSNTYAGAITLKVNGSTAYPIYINGTASSATNYTLPAGSYLVYFDGTNMYFRTDGIIPGTEPKEVTISTAGAVTQALGAGKIYHFTGALTSLTITLNAAGTGEIAQYHFDFDSGSTAPTVTLPGTVTMQGGTFSPEASKHYEVDILNGYGVSLAW